MRYFFTKKLGIDLGTANTLVFVPKKGVVVNEPSVVAITPDNHRVAAVGAQAYQMLGKTPDIIKTFKPLKDGVIADYRVTLAMLRYFIDKTLGSVRFFKPSVVVSIPGGATSTERRAVLNAAREAGARESFVVKEPILAALGAGIQINSSTGHMIVNIGGGTTEVAVISLGGIVCSTSIRVAGNALDESITEYIRKKFGLAVGEQTAEKIKKQIGTAVMIKDKSDLDIRGRDLMYGLPKTIKITANETAEAMSRPLRDIIDAVKKVFSETPPELTADIINQGIVVSGGSAMLSNIDQFISDAVKVPVYIAEESIFCVAKGTGIILDNLELYKRSVMSYR